MAEEEVQIREEEAQEERQETVAAEERRIGELEGELARLREALEEREGEVGALREDLAAAVARYRAAVLAASPELPEELIRGETVEEIEASLAAARDIVERVRRQLESQVTSERVPAGAPPRTSPDLSALSPREKIAYALTRQAG